MEEQILGDYQLIKQIGSGALGNVFLAEHRFIKKLFVLKVLPPELSQDRGFIERFEEEIAKLAQLDHPHLVKMHNVSFSEGYHFLVNDCIVDSFGETTNLAQYMSGRKERLEEEELLRILNQVAETLDYVHKAGIVHCALKLNNILIGKKKSEVDIFISDSGLAKMISPGKVVLRSFETVAHALNALPSEGYGEGRYIPTPCNPEKQSKLAQSFLQTFGFLAPEQKRFEHVGVQADTYAFGVLTYYLITGNFPEGIFEKPSEVAAEYQHDWDSVVLQCLNFDPNRRPTQLAKLLDKKRNEVAMKQDSEFIQPPLRPIDNKLMQKEETSLKPLIQRTCEVAQLETPLLVTATAARCFVDVKDQPKVSPSEQEGNYAQQLNTMLNRDPVITQYQPEKKETKTIEPLQTEMVVISGGQFTRGSNGGNRDEMPVHKIHIESFAIDIHPITNEQFVRFLEFTGGEKDQNYNDLIRLKDSRISRSGGKLSIEPGYSKHPVVGVTWYGAIGYAKWAGKRLPYESEWEIASRGGLENFLYPSGDQIGKNQANFFSSDTTPVMSYAPNGYGLFDMAGNVYEWCQDWYGYNYYETSSAEPHNPKGPPQGVYRVLRGGCWKSLEEDMRCSHRQRNNPGTVNSTYGFRCAANTI
jgi:formylglycine-generating enzyme required for sulfatase activity